MFHISDCMLDAESLMRPCMGREGPEKEFEVSGEKSGELSSLPAPVMPKSGPEKNT